MTTITILAVVTAALPVSLVAAGLLGECSRQASTGTLSLWRRWVGGHLVLFAAIYLTTLGWAVNTSRAASPPATGEVGAETAPRSGGGLSVGDGLAMLGIALATAVSVLGASYAVAVVGAAALGAITEKPEMFGRTLIFIGLAEGLAIYGLIVSILLLERLR